MSRWRDLIEEVLSGTFFLAGCALVVYGVTMRYVFHSPVFWVDEIFTYFLLWAIMLGWSLTEKRDGIFVFTCCTIACPKTGKTG